ncbi:class I tRNA ligase family protein, partial [Patescibacteria group bacterium]|nr:class I tRNA ligase family protein [Patescibacteria group bacterium]
MLEPYDHRAVEQKWQEKWEKEQVFRTPDPASGDDKLYVLDFFPYPSAYSLHVGHLLGYTGTDIVSRIARMQGKKVLHPMGWDAFGLPAENFAIKSGIHPAISTERNITEFKRQFGQTGISYDWSKEINASDPGYYKWTQWFF